MYRVIFFQLIIQTPDWSLRVLSLDRQSVKFFAGLLIPNLFCCIATVLIKKTIFECCNLIVFTCIIELEFLESGPLWKHYIFGFSKMSLITCRNCLLRLVTWNVMEYIMTEVADQRYIVNFCINWFWRILCVLQLFRTKTSLFS